MAYELTSSTRRAIRRAMGIRCEIHDAGIYQERLIDLSSRGARVTSRRPLRPGTTLDVQFATDAGRWETRAQVRHSFRGHRGGGIAGLEFMPLSPAQARGLETVLRGRPPILPHARGNLEVRWLELDVEWDEDLGDRVNTVSFRETATFVDDGPGLLEARVEGAVRLPIHLRATA